MLSRLRLLDSFIFIVVDLSIKPLNKIITVLRGIASGSLDLKERINIKSKDEFGVELADTFNKYGRQNRITKPGN